MKVQDWYQKITCKAETVPRDASIRDVLHAIRKNMVSRTVFVVDDGGKLLGALPVRTLLRMLGAKYYQRDALDLVQEIMSNRAEDMMVSSPSVRAEDDLEDALRKIVQSDQEDLPVVDSEGHVIGELNCFEIIEAYTHR